MTETSSLVAALAELQTQLPRVTKDATNPHFKSRYATLDAISAALLPIMGKLGLSFTCRPTMCDGAFVLAYQLAHSPTGEHIDGRYPLPAAGNPQQIGSAITYARRYALCAVTGLAPDDDDDDGNEASSGDSKRSARSLTPAHRASQALHLGNQLLGVARDNELARRAAVPYLPAEYMEMEQASALIAAVAYLPAEYMEQASALIAAAIMDGDPVIVTDES